jgi:hypothetical protein
MNQEREADNNGVRNCYVAFCDILGFSNSILTEFDRTLDIYKGFGDLISGFPLKEVQVTMYSDAILVTSDSLPRVLQAVQGLWFYAVSHGFMIRGAIAKGRYWEKRQDNHFFVASDALVRAVKLEKAVGIPAVVIADDIEIEDRYWLARFTEGVFVTPLLHFRDRNIVNPFGIYWYRSAADHVRELLARHPEHRDKYLWYLSLHEAVGKGWELIPSDVLARFLRDGILRDASKGQNIEPQDSAG